MNTATSFDDLPGRKTSYLRSLRKKYWPLYMGIAELAAQQSAATRHKVGAVVVSTEGMIAPGWNGTPPGIPNQCEQLQYVPEEGRKRLKTLPWVIHAETNAMDKMLREGFSTKGAFLFTTRAPCMQCALKIQSAGIHTVVFRDPHDDPSGIELLEQCGIHVTQYFLPCQYLIGAQ